MDPRSRTLALCHYVDDSGSENTRFTLMGGPVFSQKGSFSFSYQWERICDLRGVQLPVHMRDFARPDGRLAHLSDDERRALFYELVYLINSNKAYGLTVAVDNLELQEFFPASAFRGYMGAAPLAFLWCMILNHIMVRDHDRLDRMAYLVARSPNYNPLVTECYDFWKSGELRIGQEHTGALAFDDLPKVNALQAADMVAWANHRKRSGGSFDQGFEALELLTRYVQSDVKPSPHLHFEVTSESTRKLAEILGAPARQKGKKISLLGLIPAEVAELLADAKVDHDDSAS